MRLAFQLITALALLAVLFVTALMVSDLIRSLTPEVSPQTVYNMLSSYGLLFFLLGYYIINHDQHKN